MNEDIIIRRETEQDYRAVEELTRVSGIGEKTVEELLPYATAGQDEGEEALREDTGS